jgi:hypothetical protein
MLPPLTDMLARITSGSLLPPETVAAMDHNAILDARDGDADFEAEWLRCYKTIEEQWNAAEIDAAATALKEDVRRESFLTVSRATTQHEIASYVSDDFDLIARASLLGMNDPFVNRMWEAYDRGEIPAPKGE